MNISIDSRVKTVIVSLKVIVMNKAEGHKHDHKVGNWSWRHLRDFISSMSTQNM